MLQSLYLQYPSAQKTGAKKIGMQQKNGHAVEYDRFAAVASSTTSASRCCIRVRPHRAALHQLHAQQADAALALRKSTVLCRSMVVISDKVMKCSHKPSLLSRCSVCCPMLQILGGRRPSVSPMWQLISPMHRFRQLHDVLLANRCFAREVPSEPGVDLTSCQAPSRNQGVLVAEGRWCFFGALQGWQHLLPRKPPDKRGAHQIWW